MNELYVAIPEKVKHHTAGWKLALWIQRVLQEVLWIPTHVASLMRFRGPHRKKGPFCAMSDFSWSGVFENSKAEIMLECQHFLREYRDDGRTYQPINFLGAVLSESQQRSAPYSGFPATIRALRQLGTPIIGAKLCVLRPGECIVEHTDFRANAITVHLVVDGVEQGNFVAAAGRIHELVPGQFMVFNPSYVHSAWNDSDRPRWLFNVCLYDGNWLWSGQFQQWLHNLYSFRIAPAISRSARYFIGYS